MKKFIIKNFYYSEQILLSQENSKGIQQYQKSHNLNFQITEIILFNPFCSHITPKVSIQISFPTAIYT